MITFQCPTCDREIEAAERNEAPFRPFCSERCKLIDLGRWLDGTYVVSDPVDREQIRTAFPHHDS